MTKGSGFQEIQTLLSFPVGGPQERKRLLVAALLGFAGFIIPVIPGIFLIGYGGLIMQSIIHEKAQPAMPEWKDWGKIFTLGLRMLGAAFVYSLPAVLAVLLGYVGLMVPALLEALSQAQDYTGSPPFGGLDVLGMFGGMALLGIGLILLAPLSVMLPPMLGHVAATDSFAAAFHFRAWWRVFRANLGGFAVALVLAAGLYFIVIFVLQILYLTIILCIAIPFLLAFLIAYLTIIANALFAEAYREGSANLSGTGS